MSDTTSLSVIERKRVSLQACIVRAREEYATAGAEFASDYTRQDAAILNIIRACETALNIANHLIRLKKLGIPAQSRDSFRLLQQARLIPADLADALIGMLGFRNIAVHRYEELNLAIVTTVIEDKLDDMLTFTDQIQQALQPEHKV